MTGAASLARGVPYVRGSAPVTRYDRAARLVVAVAAVNALAIVLLWAVHFGMRTTGSTADDVTGAGQLTGLLGTYLVLIQLLLASRTAWLEQRFGLDRLLHLHRWNGFAAVLLLAAHTVLITVGYGLIERTSVVGEFVRLQRSYADVLMATVAMALLLGVAGTSVRIARRRLAYETWYFVHLYTYVAIALAFAHQLAVGADFADQPWARAYWIALYVATAAALVAFRLARPLRGAFRHRLRVARVVREAPGVVSLHITGRDLDRLGAQAGQFFLWRFLTPSGWWRAHPFSLSAVPDGAQLRCTIKELGDWSRALQQVRPGTRVVAEGPYGRFTADLRSREKVLLIAGGVGITPLRALFEEIDASPGQVLLLYRARRAEDLVFREELDELARQRGFGVRYGVGPRHRWTAAGDPFGPRRLSRTVPDLVERDVFVCGPPSLIAAARAGLRAAGVPDRQIHVEEFAY